MTPPDVPSNGRRRRVRRWRRRADLKVILPIVITLGLVGYVALLATGPRSGGQLWAIVRETWWSILLLTVPYIAARAILWHELLEQLGIVVPWRPTLAALAGGEIAKTVPGGVYVQNYLLARLANFGELPIVRSSTATTAALGLESLLALPIALFIGIPNTPWLFWALIGIVVSWLALIVLLWLLVHTWEVHLAPGTPPWLRAGLRIGAEFLDAAKDLCTWRTVRALVPTATYMLIYVADLYLIAGAVGIHDISFVQTMSIYAIVVLTVILIPIPTKLGTTELTGLTAFVAYGIPGPTAAIIMLGLRLMASGATILLAAALLLILRREFATASARGSQPGAAPAGATPSDRP
ncbi:MAG TPA: lysylphosphatidylglycerol synthase domain-containing protein [Thermomicrobiales bacterium]|jgi:uncharacterized membrane protein YbhN (UPF0104 family)|nr:lysylphosphatidylglycerol synthase domain-containing protein [Thermomicrobiales bacterium]